jgi:putative acetyltransferase
MVTTLDTERLTLRPFQPNDAIDLYDYAKRPEVGPNAGWNPLKSMEESQSVVARFIDQGDTWAIEHKPTKRMIGSIGLHLHTDLKGRLYHELGFALSPDYQGYGYMNEAVNAVLYHAFMDKDIAVVKVYHFMDNLKSERVIQRLGFIYDQTVVYQTVSTGEKIAKSYHLTQKEYKDKKGIK